MKKLILILMVGNFFMGCMPPKLAVPLTKEQMSHQIIFNTDKSKDEVFDVSLEWMAKTFVSSKAVIEYKDKPSGKIIGKGYLTMILDAMGMSVPIQYHFTLSIEIKEGRYRLLFENFKGGIQKVPMQGIYKTELEQLEKLKIELTELGETLDSYIKNAQSRKEW